MLVAHHLNLDVARVLDEFFEEDAVVAEGRFRFGLHRRKAVGHVGIGVGDADALAAAAGRGLDHDRIADLARDADGFFRRFDQAHVTRHSRDPGLGGQLFRADLVAHGVDGFGIRADKGDTLVAQAAGEAGVLGQEAKAGVHSLCAGLSHGVDDPVGQQIGFRRGGRADQNSLIGHLDGQRAGVSLGIDLDRPNTHPAAGLDNADGDFAPVGDQNLGKHSRSHRHRRMWEINAL